MISSSLFKKYNVPGPRYTSYPTVPYWEKNPTVEEWISAISNSLTQASGAQGAAVYVHIPFCQSLCTYCGCNTRITRNKAVGKPYVETVLDEWRLYRERLGIKELPLGELHLGGGTPTFLDVSELRLLLEGLFSSMRPTRASEFSIEVDPRVTSRDQLALLKEFGFTRISLGVQDFDPKVQEIVHRVQSEQEVASITQAARELGFESVNYDLIYGLPFQTQSSIESTMEVVRRLRPDRIAFYAYAHVPWIKPGQRRFTETDLPNGDAKRALYELGRAALEADGYREIGMDHFALESDSLWKASVSGDLHRSFMGYSSRRVAPQIGLGVSAIGDSWTAFAQNEKLLETYQERVAQEEIPIVRGHILDEEDLILRQHILNLMTRFETDWSQAERSTPYLKEVPAQLKELQTDGLIQLGTHSCRITELGRAFIRNICMAFDARLARKAADQSTATQLFSKTI